MDQEFRILVHFFLEFMNYVRTFSISVLCVSSAQLLIAQRDRTITVSPAIGLTPWSRGFERYGFQREVECRFSSRRPDGTEFPVLTMYTNDQGEFVHDIDTSCFRLVYTKSG